MKNSAASVVLVLMYLLTGCGSSYYTQQIESGRQVPWFVYKLGDYPDDARATRLLCDMLNSEKKDIRCCAVVALRSHLVNDDMRCEILHALIPLLADEAYGTMHRPIAGSLLPGGTVDVGFIRLETLVALSHATRQDFGYDIAAWQKYLDDLCRLR